MPETVNQGAASQPDIPTTSYTLTVVEQRIYRMTVPAHLLPRAVTPKNAYSLALDQLQAVLPEIRFAGTVEWRRPSGGFSTWEVPPIGDDNKPENK